MDSATVFERIQSLLLTQLIPEKELTYLIERLDMDKGVTKLPTRRLLDVLVLGSVFQKNSYRDIADCYGVAKSTISDALGRRSWVFFREVFSLALNEIIRQSPTAKDRASARDLLALDSSVCQLHGSLAKKHLALKEAKLKAGIKLHAVWNVEGQWVEDFNITGYRKHDGAAAKTMNFARGKIYVFDRAYVDVALWKMITEAGSNFVTRLKKCGSRLKHIHDQIGLPENTKEVGVLYDGHWVISEAASYRQGAKAKSLSYRHIIYRDPVSKKIFDFVTSDQKSAAQEICDIYKKRWAVELLFRWLKGHLNIRRLAVRNLNAIRIQLVVSVLVQVLVRLKKLREKLGNSNWEILRGLRNNLDRQFAQMLWGCGFAGVHAARTGPRAAYADAS